MFCPTSPMTHVRHHLLTVMTQCVMRERVQDSPRPRLIRRYGNRKLYDVAARAYVTLEDLRDLVCRGEELQVLDQKTGEDTTSLTLAQILLEAQRARTARIPRLLLVQLVRLSAGSGAGPGATPRAAVHRARVEAEKIAGGLLARGTPEPRGGHGPPPRYRALGQRPRGRGPGGARSRRPPLAGATPAGAGAWPRPPTDAPARGASARPGARGAAATVHDDRKGVGDGEEEDDEKDGATSVTNRRKPQGRAFVEPGPTWWPR